MIKHDALTPASASEYMERLRAALREFDLADAALCRAWDERNDARWPRHSSCLADMRPANDPLVLAAEAKVEEARAAWRAAHAAFVAFARVELVLVCGVSDYRHGRASMHVRCALPADHIGRHDFEINDQTGGTAGFEGIENPGLAEAGPDWMRRGS